MEYVLKQRLVGAAVIIALAVIFIPMLLNGEGPQGLRKIPEMPKVEGAANRGVIREQPVPAPQHGIRVVTDKAEKKPVASKPEARKPASQPVSKPVVKKPAVKPAVVAKKPAVKPAPPTKKPAAKKPGAMTSWAVQVGIFNDKKRALLLQEKLRAKKYSAYVEDVPGAAAGQHRFRVRVGPVADRVQAEKLLVRLRKDKAYAKSFITTHP